MHIQMPNERPFSEEDNEGVATVRTAGFDIVSSAGVTVGRCRMAVVREEGKPVRLRFVFAPMKDMGFETIREEELHGPVAAAFCELISAAAPYVGNHHRVKRDDPDSL